MLREDSPLFSHTVAQHPTLPNSPSVLPLLSRGAKRQQSRKPTPPISEICAREKGSIDF